MKDRKTKARFFFSKHSGAFKRKVEWKIVASNSGVSAQRDDGRKVSISWQQLIGAAMFYGCDSERGQP
jgi:hypothetical protein